LCCGHGRWTGSQLTLDTLCTTWIPVDTGTAYVREGAVRERYSGAPSAQRWLDSAMALLKGEHSDTAHIGAVLDSVIGNRTALPSDYPAEAVIRGVGLEPIVDVVIRNSDERPANDCGAAVEQIVLIGRCWKGNGCAAVAEDGWARS
jgi:hypothetical protein